MYDIGNLYEAKSLQDACSLLLQYPQAQILAGGSDILVQIREGKRAGKDFVSINALNELRKIELLPNGDIKIYSLSTFTYIIEHPLIKEKIPVLAQALLQIGSPQIRNVGTIGGNTCNGVTSADSAATLLAYDSIVEIHGLDYCRYLPLEKFYLGAGKVDLKVGEIQTAIIIKKASYENYQAWYIKYAMREALDIATLSCSVNLKLSEDKKLIEDIRIAYGVAAPIPIRAKNTELMLRGQEITEDLIYKACQEVLTDIRPRDSWRASKDFRLHLAKVLLKRCIIYSLNLAGGTIDGSL